MKTEERIEKIRGHLNMAYSTCEGNLSLLTEALAKGMEEQGRSSEYVRKGIFAAFAIAIKKTIDRSNNRRQQLKRIWGRKKKSNM